ncbi:hypothetical protein AB0J43_08260 [Nonomuraea fuscirosea]
MSTWGAWLQKWRAGGNRASGETSGDGLLDLFSVQALYDRYGRAIYARAAADAAFSAAISDMVATIQESPQQKGPRVAKLLTDKTGLTFYLLGHTHTVLASLLDASVRPDSPSPASADPDFAVIRLGALFHLAFDGGLLQLPDHGEAPRSAR